MCGCGHTKHITHTHTHTYTHTASYAEVVELEPLLPDMYVAAEKAVIARNDVKRETKIVLGPNNKELDKWGLDDDDEDNDTKGDKKRYVLVCMCMCVCVRACVYVCV